MSRYKADLTAGSLKLPESRIIADLLLRELSANDWQEAIERRNVLRTKQVATAQRLTRLIRGRLETMGPELWKIVRDGAGTVAAHAVLAAAVKHSPLLGDFLAQVVAAQYRLFSPTLPTGIFSHWLEECRERDALMPLWNESTLRRLRSTVFQVLAQAGYIDSTRTRRLQTVHIAEQVLRYLKNHKEDYVLHCIQVSP